jgi:hypothetical protein
MRLNLRYCFFFILAFSLPILSYAQVDYFDSLLIEEVKVENPIYKPVVGVGFGMFNFFGDVNDNFQNLSSGKPGGKLTVSSYIDKKHILKYDIYVLFGSLTGNESNTKPEQNLNFTTQIFGIGANLHYEFAHFIGARKFAASPFVELGVGTIQFSPKGDLKDSEGNLYNYAPDGTIRDINDFIAARDYSYESDLRSLDLYGNGNYSQFGITIPVGIGLNATLSKRVSMRVGTSFNFTTSDFIDNVSHKGSMPVSNKRPDFFNFSYISFHLDLFSEPEYITVEKMYADFEMDDIFLEDEDQDWVLDFGDECPDTPYGVEVDTLGCPLDGDGDLVYDFMDKELDSPPGAFVDDNGVQIEDSVLISMMQPGETIQREDLEYYLSMMRESDQKVILRPQGVPLQYKAFDLDDDDYLSFDELLFGIRQYFDFRTLLSLEMIYEMMEFYFLQD